MRHSLTRDKSLAVASTHAVDGKWVGHRFSANGGRLLSALVSGLLLIAISGCGVDTGTNPTTSAAQQNPAPAPAPDPGTGSGTGAGTGDGTSGGSSGGSVDPTAIALTWFGVQANILQPFCTVCHSGPTPPGGPFLGSGSVQHGGR